MNIGEIISVVTLLFGAVLGLSAMFSRLGPAALSASSRIRTRSAPVAIRNFAPLMAACSCSHI